jgi:UDP-4-amino-4-deoxy-L-arabinose formyltransferase/UDP-glucuronic acid dehydrogenase (UDP-4-keto-hexauronic acid decarboxylating)
VLLNVLLVAEESAGGQVLRMLAQRPGVRLTVLTSQPGGGRGATVSQIAGSLGLDVLPAELVRDADLATWIQSQRTHLLLNVHSLFVVHPAVVEAPTIGSFNLHPGPLPEYAGLNTPSWGVYHGERRFGVTLHWMDAGIDTGPIAFAETFEIDEADTGLTVTMKCIKHGVDQVSMLVGAAADGLHPPKIRQDLAKRRYFGHEIPHGGIIQWDLPAREIVNLVRACDFLPFSSPWGQPTARLGDRDVALAKAALTHEQTSEPPGTVRSGELEKVLVAAQDEWVAVHAILADGQVVPASKRIAPA